MGAGAGLVEEIVVCWSGVWDVGIVEPRLRFTRYNKSLDWSDDGLGGVFHLLVTRWELAS